MATLAELQSEINAHVDYKDLDQAGWEMKIEYRGITHRSKKDFDALIPMYVRKISDIRESLTGDWNFMLTPMVGGELKTPEELGAELTEQLQYHLAKNDRLLDKLAVCLKEVELRELGLVTRTDLHDQTDYYIDYTGGNDGSAGTAIGTAWKTITKYTTDTVRTAGDRAFIRANVTWTQGTEAVDITFDEDGTLDSYIELIGCDSVTNDPWSDASDVKPIIDFEDAAFQMIADESFWRITRLDLRQSADGNGAMRINGGDDVYIKDCNVQDGASSAVEGIYVNAGERCTLDGCSTLDTNGNSIEAHNSPSLQIMDCTITAGVDVGSTNGLNPEDGTTVYMRDTTFAGAFGTNDIDVGHGSTVFMRNVTLSASGTRAQQDGKLVSEDHDGTFESHFSDLENGTITRDTGTVRGGGADSSAKMEPTSLCGPNRPLRLGDRLRGFSRMWVTAGSYTATVYVSVGSAWDSALTAAECYLITSELDNAGNATRVERQSAQQITNDTNWTALTTSISPAREGWVYFWLYLAEFEDATEHIFVDIKPTIA